MNQIVTYTAAAVIFEFKTADSKKFAETYKDFDLVQTTAVIRRAIDGLTDNQIKLGIETMWQKGYLPSMLLFRQWCLGNTDFKLSDDIADSYTNKHHALSQIIKWQGNADTPITVAMKQAYDDTYHLWRDVVSESDQTKAELAFKGAYEHIVKELVKERVMCEAYTQPIMLTNEKPITPKKPIADKETAMAFLAKLKPALAKAVA